MSSNSNGRTRHPLLAFAGLLLFLVCGLTIPLSGFDWEELQGDGSPGDSAGPPVPVSDVQWYEIYFTNPDCPPEENRHGGIDEIIAADILRAQRSLDIAAFDLDSQPIVSALIALEGQGIEPRVVTDTDNEEQASIRRLRRNGISVVTDERSALMHNKFIVIDGEVVWTGSMNFTSNDVYCHNNNSVRFAAPELARNYTREMDEMYAGRSFGPRSPADTPDPQLTIHGARVDNYFASEEDVAPLLANLISQAEESIQFMAFSFTRDDMGEAMLERAEAGILIEGVFETTGSETEYSYYPVFRDAGLPNLRVLQDGNPRNMHHKVLIIDSEIVAFGSFNFSDSANDSNDENVVVVYDPAFARYFQEEFDFVWAEAEGREE